MESDVNISITVPLKQRGNVDGGCFVTVLTVSKSLPNDHMDTELLFITA